MSSYEEIAAITARVDDGEAVTDDEAEAVVRAIRRVCKGPIKDGAEAEYALMREAVGGFGGSEKGYDLGAMDAVLREGCGYDFNDTICQFPFDGKERDYVCPKCGIRGTFTSPKCNIKG